MQVENDSSPVSAKVNMFALVTRDSPYGGFPPAHNFYALADGNLTGLTLANKTRDDA